MSLSAVSSSIRNAVENYSSFIRKPTVTVASAAFGFYHAISGNRYLAAAGIASTILSIYLQRPDTLTAEKFSGQVNRFIDEVHSSLQDRSFHAKKNRFCGRFREICAFEGASTISDDQRVRLNQVREILSNPLPPEQIQQVPGDLNRLVERCRGMETNTLLPSEERAARVKEYNRLNQICWKWGGRYKADLDDIRNRMPPKISENPAASSNMAAPTRTPPSETRASLIPETIICDRILTSLAYVQMAIDRAKTAGTFDARRREFIDNFACALDWAEPYDPIEFISRHPTLEQPVRAMERVLNCTVAVALASAAALRTDATENRPSIILSSVPPFTTQTFSSASVSASPLTRAQLGAAAENLLNRIREAKRATTFETQRRKLVREYEELGRTLMGSLSEAEQAIMDNIFDELLSPRKGAR